MLDKEKIIYFILDVSNKALPFLMVPYITSNVSLSDYGYIELFTSLYVVMGFFVSFGFEGWLTSNYFKKPEIEIKRTIISYICFSFIVSFIIFIILIIISPILSTAIFIAFTNAMLFLVTTLLRLKNKFSLSGVILFLNSSLNILFMVILFNLISASYHIRVLSFFSASLISILVIFSILNKYIKPYPKKINFHEFSPVILFCLPICISMTSSWLKGNVDKFYITSLLSSSELAIYALAFQVSSVINVLSVTINKIFQPTFFKKMHDNLFDKKQIIYLLFSLFIMSSIYSLFVYFFFDYVFDSRYYPSKQYIFPLTISFLLSAFVMILNNYFFYYSLTRLIMYQVIISALIHIIISYFFILHYSLPGAIYSQIISSVISFVITILFMLKIKNEKYHIDNNARL